MQTISRATAVFPLFALIAVAAVGCAHAPPPPTLTSAQAPAPAPAPAPPAAVEAPKVDPAPAPAAPAADEAAPKRKKAEPEVLSFAQLSGQLGGEDALALDTQSIGDGSTVAHEGKGLSANGYSAVGATHQAVPEAETRGGDVKVSGGITVAQVRGTVHDANARLRHCYERGLQDAPRLAGNVKIMFSVDAKGLVADADSESDTLPSVVTSCVVDVFSSMTFPAPKQPPAKVVYPIEFKKE